MSTADSAEPSLGPAPDVTVVMLAFGPEPFLAAAVEAALASNGVRVEVLVIDNGSSAAICTTEPADARIRVVRPSRNLGFAAGANLGAAHGRGRVIAFVNSDALVDPDCLRHLCDHVADPRVGVAGALVVLADSPDVVNSAGNPLHVLGLSWAGMLGQPVTQVPAIRSVPSASGATMALRRQTWEQLAGFGADYFAYLEDMDLCWRAWQAGLEVHVVAAARSLHHYEFSRHATKLYLLERNRIFLLLTTYQWRTLGLLAVPLVALDAALLAVAATRGWGRQKLRSWWWLIRHWRAVAERRAWVQGRRRVADRELRWLWTTELNPVAVPLPPGTHWLTRTLAAYWRVVSRWV